jgi:hypothetical protein
LNPWSGFCRPLPYHLATSPKHSSSLPNILSKAGNGTRTRDLLLGKELFYQLNHARMTIDRSLLAESAENQDRTGDTMIFSHVLYQLSYLGLSFQAFSRKRRLL